MPNMGHGRSFLVHGRGYGGAAAPPPCAPPQGGGGHCFNLARCLLITERTPFPFAPTKWPCYDRDDPDGFTDPRRNPQRPRPGPVRQCRARCLRCRFCRPPQRPCFPRHRGAGLADFGEPGPPGRCGGRPADGRWCRAADSNPRCLLPRRNGPPGRAAAPARRIRRGHDFSAQRGGLAPGLRARAGARHCRRRPGAAGLARCAGEYRAAHVAGRALVRADHPPGIHWPGR